MVRICQLMARELLSGCRPMVRVQSSNHKTRFWPSQPRVLCGKSGVKSVPMWVGGAVKYCKLEPFAVLDDFDPVWKRTVASNLGEEV